MTKHVPLGESETVNGIAMLLGFAALATVAFLTRHALRPPLPVAAGFCAMLPFVFIRRRFGHPRVTLTTSALRFHPYGMLWFSREFPVSTIHRVSERRISAPDEKLGPIWAIELELVDSTRVQVGRFRNPKIHELIAQLNAVVPASDAHPGP